MNSELHVLLVTNKLYSVCLSGGKVTLPCSRSLVGIPPPYNYMYMVPVISNSWCTSVILIRQTADVKDSTYPLLFTWTRVRLAIDPAETLAVDVRVGVAGDALAEGGAPEAVAGRALRAGGVSKAGGGGTGHQIVVGF